MANELVTKSDLNEFRDRLITEIKSLIHINTADSKKLLKSYQVRNLLKISPGTLQTFRVNGSLPFTKIGGTMYYKYEDIMKLFEKNNKSK